MTGLYIHVPFCARACPYCDFDFEVGRGQRLAVAIDRWLAGLERERLERAAELDGLVFDTLYLGGGTPSVLAPAELDALFEWLRTRVGIEPATLREATVELNPEHVDAARLEVLRAAGIDRVSLGVQTLAPAGLRELGRVHDRATALAAVEACVARGLRTSADLILGWRGQDLAALGRDVAELVDAGVEHVSIYALTIEPDTPWPKLVRRGLRILPDEDRQADLLLAAEAELGARGFVHYEVASYARTDAAVAIHNSKYWRWRDVIGLGPSAASVRHHAQGQAAPRSGGSEAKRSAAQGQAVTRRTNPRGLAAWLADPELAATTEVLEGPRAAAEGLWLGLRRLRGVEIAGPEGFLARFGVDRPWLDARLARQLALGNLEWTAAGTLRVAPDRWLWHDGIAVDLID